MNRYRLKFKIIIWSIFGEPDDLYDYEKSEVIIAKSKMRMISNKLKIYKMYLYLGLAYGAYAIATLIYQIIVHH